MVWLLSWEAWVAVHLFAAWRLPVLVRALMGPLADSTQQLSSLHDPWVAPMAFFTALALPWPYVMGVLPFWLAL